MRRISKTAKAVADAHIAARIADRFDDPKVRTKEEVLGFLRSGKTLRGVMEEIETKFIPIHTIVSMRMFGHVSETYRKEVYKAFKFLLD